MQKSLLGKLKNSTCSLLSLAPNTGEVLLIWNWSNRYPIRIGVTLRAYYFLRFAPVVDGKICKLRFRVLALVMFIQVDA